VSEDQDELLERPLAIDEENAERVRLRIRRRLPGRRLDKYLHGRFPHLSRTTIQRLIRQGAVTVNGQITKPSYEMSGGDIVELLIPPPEPLEIVPEDIPLDILYEDEYLIAVNKPAGMICHPARAEQSGTLVNALAFHARRLSHGSDPFRPGIVHRLDKNTTGVMLVAKEDEAHWRLALQFERRTVLKTYLAVVEGEIQLDGDMIDAPIGAHPTVREKFAVLARAGKIDIAKSAVTCYEVAERFRGYTLVKLMPRTGRTHQLRVHMSYIRHPIVGDKLYGGRPVSELSLTGRGSAEPIFEHQALHAWKIEFRHPITEKRMELEAPFPERLRRLVLILRSARSV
jgi:23S rRNA pseudouridine1911/1915/1917 synthase